MFGVWEDVWPFRYPLLLRNRRADDFRPSGANAWSNPRIIPGPSLVNWEKVAMNIVSSIAANEADLAARWLTSFEAALGARDAKVLGQHFAEDCHWRDLSAFTWNITPHQSRQPIIDGILKAQPDVRARNFKLAEDRTPPRRVTRIGGGI